MSDEKKPRLSLKSLEARVADLESSVGMHEVGEIGGVTQRYAPDIAARIDDLGRAVHALENSGAPAARPIVVDWTEGRGRVVGRSYGFRLEGNGTQVTVSTGNGGVLLTAHPNGVRICVGAQVVEVRCDHCHVLDLYNQIGGHL